MNEVFLEIVSEFSGLNGGQCVPNGQGFICNCPSTFTGNRCEAPGESNCDD